MAAVERMLKYRIKSSGRTAQSLRSSLRTTTSSLTAAAPRLPSRRASVTAAAGLSPFDVFDSQVNAIIRQSDQEFADLSQQLDRDFDNAFRRMDRMFDQSWRDMDRMQRQIDEEVSRALREAQPGVRVEQMEQRGVSSYRYYQSIEIRSGAPIALVPAHATPAAAPSPLLIAALAVTALWAAVTTQFARNYSLTLFAEKAKWRLLATWPYLAAFSAKFRSQFVAALQGRQVKAAEQEGGENSSSGTGSV